MNIRTRYPTKKEILKTGPMLDPGTQDMIARVLRGWKRVEWPPRGPATMPLLKRSAINKLTRILNAIFGKHVLLIYVEEAPSCCYMRLLNTIVLNKSLSIISFLHEYGHALYGNSELKACRFSVHLFKDAFPKSYAKLQWRGHMLVKNNHSIPWPNSPSRSTRAASTSNARNTRTTAGKSPPKANARKKGGSSRARRQPTN